MPGKIDFFELLNSGRSGSIALGKTPWKYFKELDPDVVFTQLDSKLPGRPMWGKASWYSIYFSKTARPNLDGLEVYFQRSREVRHDLPGRGWGYPTLKGSKLTFGKYKWQEILTLPDAIFRLKDEKYSWRSRPDQQVVLFWALGNRRLKLVYSLSSQMSGGAFVFDYFLTRASIERVSKKYNWKSSLHKYLYQF
jgi:hypothetical protein